MICVAHRINTAAQLRETPVEQGVEMDIRSQGDRLVVHHDPFVQGEDFAAWLKDYRHQLLILNVKEEGLEDRVLQLMREHEVSDFFFLDQSFPFLIKTGRTGEKRCAVRYSEFESLETCLSLEGMVEWVWVDCFTKFPLTSDSHVKLRAAGFKLCLVSPELQGRHDPSEISSMQRAIHDNKMHIDAVCTKRPDLWANL